MALEATPAGSASDGRGLVLWVPTIANPAAPTVAELTAGTVVPITYSLTPDGFAHDTTENTISDGRYTLKQVLELPGTVTDTLELTYVAGTPAQTALVEGTDGFIVHRIGVLNETAIAAAQKVDVIPVRAGIQRKVAPTANTLLSRMSKMFVTGTVRRDVAVAA
tara:strand:+ start:658 stop:1149 length:492 start_codon:yes stop_codon:yes gene_type:complete